MPKQKNAKGKSWSPRGPLSPLKIFTLKMAIPYIGELISRKPNVIILRSYQALRVETANLVYFSAYIIRLLYKVVDFVV